MQERILVVGAADMDLSLPMRALPRAGEASVEDGRFRYAAGGSGAVTALALSHLGAEALLCARVGNDNHGSRLLHLYRTAELDCRFVSLDRRAPTGLRVALCEDAGNTRTVYYPGANRHLSLSDVENAIATASPEALYLPTDLPSDILLGVSRLASSRNIPVWAEYGMTDPDLPLSAMARMEIFSPDDRETYALTGTFPVGSDSCLKAAVELEKLVKARYYLIKLGERGVFLYDGRYCHVVPAFGVRMAEGEPLCDTLSAAILLEYLRNGRDILNACRYGLALNAILKNSPDQNSFPEADEIREFAARH